MFIVVEGRKNWGAERAFVEAFKKEEEGAGALLTEFRTVDTFLGLVRQEIEHGPTAFGVPLP